MEDLHEEFGPKWAYHCAGMIDRIDTYYHLQECDDYKAKKDAYLHFISESELDEQYGPHWELILCIEIANHEMRDQETTDVPF